MHHPAGTALCAALSVFAALVASAVRAQDVAGSKDYPLISRYAGSTIVEYSRQFDQYTVVLGAPKDEKWSKSQQLEGTVTRIRYDIPEHRSALEVFRNYQTALKNGGFVELFACTGQAQCVGSQSLGWCGGCSPQHLSAKLARPEGDVYVSLHIEQDNPDTHAQASLDVIEVKPMDTGLVSVTADSLARDITGTGHASVYGIYFDTGKADVRPESDGTLKEIATLLQRNAQLKLYVVGHTDNQGTLDTNMDLSRRRAD
ncbi:MAG TPA: DUF4892 domain-containing protein, partial [Steroidobacteraceae bacterium]|nr:DUF4892 domain-containing protein [Steroidobacteraceae bacterium]